MGLCENIESNVGQYFLDTDSECPNTDNSWKDFENNIIVDANVRELKVGCPQFWNILSVTFEF